MKKELEKKQFENLIKKGFNLTQIAKELGLCGPSNVRYYLKKFNLEIKSRSKWWTEDEDKFLIENYSKMGRAYCSEKLNRSKDSVFQRASRLGVKYDYPLKNYSKETLEKEYFENGLTVKDISKKYKIGYWSTYAAFLYYDIPMKKDRPSGNKHYSWTGYEEISGSHWVSIKQSAKGRARIIDFDITIEEAWNLFVKQDRKCALSGVYIEFKHGKERYSGTTASLDRVDSSIGYTIENCQWVHKDINKMKFDLDQDTFIRWCKDVYEYNKGKL